MGPLGMARAGGQILFDLAFRNPEDLIGTPETLGKAIASRVIPNGSLSPWAENAVRFIRQHSLVNQDPVLSCTVLCRLAAIDLLLGGRFSGPQAD